MGYVRVVFHKDGTVKFEGMDFTGTDCERAVEEARRLLGEKADTLESAYKPEYYMQPEQQQEIRQ